MTNTPFMRKKLRAGTALQALALLGAGVVASAAFVAPASAQDFTNVNATGRVQSTSGAAIAGATVTVTSNDQGFTRSATTNSSGLFRIGQLPMGTYTFTISADGFDTFTDSNVPLSQGQTANQFTLAPAGAAASGDIVVTAGRVTVNDFDRTTTGTVVNVADLAQRVPVSRSLSAIIQLAPGAASGDSAFGDLATAVGSSVSENVFYVNGLNTTEFRNGLGSSTVPFDFYQTVEVKEGGYAAEFGRSTGAFVNAVTKSGSNDFHASVLFNWEPNELHADSPNTNTADNDHDASERIETIFQVSGPIIKDHLFFYGLYDFRNVSSNAAPRQAIRDADGNVTGFQGFGRGVNDLYYQTNSPFYGGKVDAVITDGQRLEFTYFNTKNVTHIRAYDYDANTNSDGAYVGDETDTVGGENYVARYTGSFTDWLTVSAAYGKNKNADNTTTSNTNYPYIADYRGAFGRSIGNFVNFLQQAEDTREFYRGDVDVYVNLLGSHHFRAGYDRENLKSVIDQSYTGDVAYEYDPGGPGDTYGVPTGVDYIVARTYRNAGTFKAVNESFYLEDSWTLLDNRLTLNLGVRDDKFVDKNVAGVTYYDSGDNFAPRLAFSLDPFGTGRTKVYGSFGRYFLPIPVNTNIRLGGKELDFDRINYLDGLNPDNTPIIGGPVLAYQDCPIGGGNNCVIRTDGTVKPTDSTVAKNLENQSVDEYILGYEQRIGERIKIGVYGTYRTLNQSLEDSAIDQAVVAYCLDNNIQGCENTYYGAYQYVLNNPGEDMEVTLSAPLPGETERRTITLSADDLGYPHAKRKYEAITATFDREFDGVWSLSGSYTYSKTLGNIEGGVKSDNGQTDSGLTTDFDFPSLQRGSYGYLPNDHRHNFKLYGSYQPFEWMRVGINFQAESPRHFGCNGTVAASVSSPALIQSGQSFDYGYAYGAAGHYCNLNSDGSVRTTPAAAGETLPDRQLVQRGSAFQSDWLTQTDLDIDFKLPVDFDATLRFSVFNLFNQKAKLDFQETGTTSGGSPAVSYHDITGYQAPRYVRVQLGIGF